VSALRPPLPEDGEAVTVLGPNGIGHLPADDGNKRQRRQRRPAAEAVTILGTDLVLVEDAAAELGVATSTLHEWIRKGEFPARRRPHTRRYFIPRSELAAWVDGCELETKRLAGGGLTVKPKKKR
jgi:excisionase family DNA binding protein